MKSVRDRFRPNLIILAALCVVVPALAQAQVQPPNLQKSFHPSIIGPGGVTTLRLEIANPGPTPVRELAFTDPLPAGVTIAAAPNLESSCGGQVSAPAGGTVVALNDGQIGFASVCVIAVDVTAALPGGHTNTTSDLTSGAGTSPPATAVLTVENNRPGFAKAFSPASISFGGRSTLTLTIDNSSNTSRAYDLRFSDPLPVGMVIASPLNASTTCAGGAVVAAPGGSLVSYGPLFPGDASVELGSSCTVSVDVVGGAVGVLDNVTGELTSSSNPGGTAISSGAASASLEVVVDRISLDKTFVDDPVTQGGTTTLEFTVMNLDRRSHATSISFSDDLDATLPGLVAVGLPLTDPCGPGSSLSGTGLISLANGSLGPAGSCTFAVAVQVPAGASSGVFTNTTSSITAQIDGSEVVGSPASDVVIVRPIPVLTKEFTDDPATPGGEVTLEFSITNASKTPATDLSFDDVFVAQLSTATTPADGFCGSGSTAVFTSASSFEGAILRVRGGSLGAGESCTFSVTLGVVDDAPSGIYPNTTSNLNAMIDGEPATGSPASDDLHIVAAPDLTKEFIDNPVSPGGTVMLQFTLSNSENGPGDATSITFTDDLDATVMGLVAVGLPVSDVCGVGSQLDGTSMLTLTGAGLAPGESCVFSVELQVPSEAPPGAHTNTTSAVVATVLGVETTSPPATADLRIAGLSLSKRFTDDPVLPGGTVTLEFTIANTSASPAAANIFFTDDLDAVIDSLHVVSTLPMNDVCGVGSSLSGLSANTLLVFQGGALAAGESCTFAVTLEVPVGTMPDTYGNTTSGFRAEIDGLLVFFDNATDRLNVVTEFLSMTKEFLGDPVGAGDDVTLRFSITNLNADEAVSDIAFTDDLDAALAGLTSTSGPLTDVCGAGSELSGVNILAFTGGVLGAGATCQFDVALSMPASVPLGTEAVNRTSEVSGSIGGLGVTGAPAVDELQINLLTFSKVFGGDVEPGDTASLTFTIANLSATDNAADLSFVDVLDDMIPGLEAVGLPSTGVCGAGSEVSGTSTLMLTGGSVPPLGSCTFTVDVSVPASTTPGAYLNVTSDLRRGGAPVSPPATASLTVLEPPPILDSDNDDVLDDIDMCPGTEIPEAVPTRRLLFFRHALEDDDTTFDTRVPPHWPLGTTTFTTTDTSGCSCDQIVDELHLPPFIAELQRRYGCSPLVMKLWLVIKDSDSTSKEIDEAWKRLLRSEGLDGT